MPLLEEEDFTSPMIYTAMAGSPPSDVPPTTGWTGDVMQGYGPPPFPKLQVTMCRFSSVGTLELDRDKTVQIDEPYTLPWHEWAWSKEEDIRQEKSSAAAAARVEAREYRRARVVALASVLLFVVILLAVVVTRPDQSRPA